MFFEYYNIADGNFFRTNRKYAFYKNSILPYKKKNILHIEITYSNHKKEILFIYRYYETRKKKYLIRITFKT